MWSWLAILPVFAILLSAATFVLQLVSLSSSQWGNFLKRRVPGVPEERGYYGLWTLCFQTAGRQEECASPSYYDLPTHAEAAGAVSILHVLLLLAFIPLAIVRLLQVLPQRPDLYIAAKRVCCVKVALSLVCAILAITIVILASVGEGRLVLRLRVYDATKGWAFWIQIIVISLDIVLMLVCAFESIQNWQLDMLEPPARDVADAYPETFISPDYDTSFERDSHERVVYMKDASVQSYLDSDGEVKTSSPVPEYPRRPERRGDGPHVIRVREDGTAVVSIGGRDTPPGRGSDRRSRY